MLDGADAVMLGAETLRGTYPLDCVRTVLSIAHQAELVFDHAHHFELLLAAAMQARPDAQRFVVRVSLEGVDGPSRTRRSWYLTMHTALRHSSQLPCMRGLTPSIAL